MKTKTEIVGYKEPFKSQLNKGWGCGYVLIPKGHPILIKLALNNDSYFYLQPDGFSDEITLSDWDKDNEYYRIGFDTAHSWNTNSHDENFVLQTTKELQSLVDSFTLEDAKKELDWHINNLKSRALKFVNLKID